MPAQNASHHDFLPSRLPPPTHARLLLPARPVGLLLRRRRCHRPCIPGDISRGPLRMGWRAAGWALNQRLRGCFLPPTLLARPAAGWPHRPRRWGRARRAEGRRRERGGRDRSTATGEITFGLGGLAQRTRACMHCTYSCTPSARTHIYALARLPAQAVPSLSLGFLARPSSRGEEARPGVATLSLARARSALDHGCMVAASS